jgi:hypothetical protein
MYTYDENIVSDLHKDARGYRPRDVWWTYWSNCTDAEKQREWDGLIYEMEESEKEEKLREQEALAQFNRDIEMYMAFGAHDRADALRWMTQNEKFYHEQDVEHLVWNLGILFTDEGRALVKELMEIVKFEENA